MRRLSIAMMALGISMLAWAGEPGARPAVSESEVNAIYPDLEKVYRDLHEHPELSGQEMRTPAKLAEELRKLGFDVTTGVGGAGVVGVLRNGAGPVAMLRTEMDALPIEERTGLPYASRVRSRNDAGQDVGVMHACGHDLHMSAWLGTARLMAGHRDRWSGTLVVIGQPAEETTGGAAPMLKDGLYARFPKPDYALAIHDYSGLPSGTVAIDAGPVTANVDAVDITIRGRGGHGARPETTVDPIVIAARTVLTLQTLISRENPPQQPAVITVGSIHGGTKHNIIPEEVKLQLTVRSESEEVRKRLLDGIRRVARAEAEAAAAPESPLVTVGDDRGYAVVNDPELARRVRSALVERLGTESLTTMPTQMVAEDFAEYGRAGVPSALIWVGATEPALCEAAARTGAAVPELHSPAFAPDLERTLKTAITVETTALLTVLGPGKTSGSAAPPPPPPPPPPPAVNLPPLAIEGKERMVDVGGRRLHSFVYGSGGPSVVLVSGFQAPQAYWNPIVPGIAAKTTVVTYDRAGYGKSETGDLPTHGKQSAADLRALLAKLAVPRPYLLVGHSYGGRIVRLYAAAYPDDVAGIVLEEAGHEDLADAQRAALSGKDLETFDEMIAPFRKPVPNPRTEAEYMLATIEQLRSSGPLPQVPLVVITATSRGGGLPPVFSKEAQAKLEAVALQMQEKLVALVPGGEQVLVDGAGHNVHLDKPDAVLSPVVGMIEKLRVAPGRRGAGG